jgi:hypothetical protein
MPLSEKNDSFLMTLAILVKDLQHLHSTAMPGGHSKADTGQNGFKESVSPD